MAHQWFGDYVTCKDWSQLWLNEGFATYYALLYEGHKFGRDDMLYGLYLDARDDIFLPENAGDHRPIVYRQYKAPMEQFDFRCYPKGSWCLHMLRSQLGDELFREAIHTYLKRHALANVESDDLREVFEELSGKPLDRFFDQWLYHGGQPELTISYDWNAKERLAHVSIEQTQATGDDVLVFQFPATLRFIVDGKTTDETFEVTERKHDFYVRLPAEPQVVRFDPEYTLLAKIEFKKSDAQFEADLKNEDDAIGRVLACEGLAARRSRSAVKALKHALQNDKFWGVRQAAARALRQIRTDEAVAALVDSTDQDDIRVRRSVVDELGQCYHDDAEAKLLEIAGDEDELPVVAAAAVRALGRIGGGKARKAIEDALASQSFSNERAIAALFAIADMNDPTMAPAVIKFIRQRGGEIDARELAQGFLTLASISQRGQRRTTALEFLSEYLSDPRTPLNALAVEALGQLHDPRARTLIEPFAAEGQNDRLIASAKRALAILDQQGEFVPGEVGELRREVRELRTSQADLQNALDEMKSKSTAAGGDSTLEEPPATDAAATDPAATDEADDGETKQPE
jgi:aminopeptidase N